MQSRKQPNSDRSLESLEARLRALPAPAVPSNLEAELLAAMPAQMPRQAAPSRFRRLAVWSGAAAGLAAACLLAVLVWPGSRSKITGPPVVGVPEKKEPVLVVTGQRWGNLPSSTPWLEIRRGLDEAPTFTWPIQEKPPMTVSLSIPSDLFD
jgi:hypothetical protein